MLNHEDDKYRLHGGICQTDSALPEGQFFPPIELQRVCIQTENSAGLAWLQFSCTFLQAVWYRTIIIQYWLRGWLVDWLAEGWLTGWGLVWETEGAKFLQEYPALGCSTHWVNSWSMQTGPNSYAVHSFPQKAPPNMATPCVVCWRSSTEDYEAHLCFLSRGNETNT